MGASKKPSLRSFSALTKGMASSKAVESTAQNVVVFCHMLFEEFLTTNNMLSTLQAFRKEWNRPSEVSSGVDFY